MEKLLQPLVIPSLCTIKTFFESNNAIVLYSSLLMIVRAAYTNDFELYFESFIFA